MKINKKSIFTAALATALAAATVVGGTYAYLQDSTEDVINSFNANQVVVELTETGDRQYNIVPGTEETKDPKVTVDNTDASYVYVKVTDTTDGLVTYEIAEGWRELQGYNGVYYREVAADAQDREFYVLKDNKVSYAAALENSDMLENGKLKENVNLTFKAYAIQMEGFESAEAAFIEAAAVKVDTGEAAEEALKSGNPVMLDANVSISASAIASAESPAVNINGKTLTITGNQYLEPKNGQTLSLKNGTVKMENTSHISISAAEGSTVRLENVEMDMGGKSMLIDSGINSARIDVIDSKIVTTDYYAISTNASNPESGEGVVINIINSEITVDDPANHDCTAVLMNVPGTLKIEDSTLTAGRQAVIVRTGTANIKNSTLVNTLEYTPESNWAKYDNAGWGSGNEVPVAVLVVGDRSKSYPWDASCTLENVTLRYGKQTERKPVYAAAYDGQTTVINGISETEVTVSADNNGVTVNP